MHLKNDRVAVVVKFFTIFSYFVLKSCMWSSCVTASAITHNIWQKIVCQVEDSMIYIIYHMQAAIVHVKVIAVTKTINPMISEKIQGLFGLLVKITKVLRNITVKQE